MTAKRALIVIPCLNEAAHIGGLIEQLEPVTAKLRARIVVADGGSSDGSPSIVQRIACAMIASRWSTIRSACKARGSISRWSNSARTWTTLFASTRMAATPTIIASG